MIPRRERGEIELATGLVDLVDLGGPRLIS